GQRVAATAAVVGEDLRAGAAFDFRRLRAGDAGVFADVGGDVVEVGALDQVGGHRGGRVAVRGARILDLVLDDPFDRRCVEAARGACRGERVIEIRADGAAGAGLGQRVAAAAFGAEEDAPVGDVGARGAAAGDREHGRYQGEGGGKQADWL